MKELLLIAALLAPALSQLGLSPSQMGTVTGRLSRNGQPAMGVRVTAMAIPEPGVRVSDAASFASIALTDGDGRYRLENIPAGRYYVTAGFLDIPTYYPGVDSINSAKAVNVEAGGTTTGIDFTTAVSAGVTVSGRVIYPPGQSVPTNLKVSLTGPQRPAPESIVNADGSFDVPRVRPGNYTLRVPPWATTVIVGDADISGVDIEVPYNVAGTIVVENSGPLPNLSPLWFASTKPGAEPQSVTLSPTGTFSTQLTPGEYLFSVSGIPAGYSLKTITAGPVDLIANPLKVVAGTPPASINVLLGVASPPPWVKVSGKVGGPGFMGVTPYPPTLTGKALLAPLQSSLLPDGSFEFPRVLPGDYTLSVTGLATRKVELHVATADLNGVEIAIPAMKDVTARVTIEGQQQGGFTMTNQGVTAANNVVYYFTSGPPASLELALTDAAGTTSTIGARQPDGTYRMRLPDGERTVKAEVKGYTVKSLTYGSIDILKDPLLKVASADTAQIDMTLVPSASGRVEGTFSSSLSIAINTLNSVRVSMSNVAGAAAGAMTYAISGGPAVAASTTVYVGPDVAQSNLLTSVPPAYPPAAAGIQGPVVVRADIDKEGTVTNVSVVRGHPLLNDAAIAAVKQRRYRPYLLNGQPTAVVTTIRVEK